MPLKFRLKGLAETFVDTIQCPGCGVCGNDDQHFATELTKVTYEGIIVVVECRSCGEIFVPKTQRLGIINSDALKVAVQRDSMETGEAIMSNLNDVKLNAERLNALKRDELQ